MTDIGALLADAVPRDGYWHAATVTLRAGRAPHIRVDGRRPRRFSWPFRR